MTRKLENGVVIIEIEADSICSRCGRQRETRDVRGDGVLVCHPCATPADLRAYGERLFGHGN